MEDIQFRKIFVSSRDRASGSNSSWMTQLPQTVHMPKNTICYITDFATAHSWYTIDSTNDRLFFVERYTGAGDAVFTHLTVVTIPSQNYDATEFAAALQVALNAATQIPGGSYSVTYNPATNTITITLTGGNLASWRAIPDRVLQNAAYRTAVSGSWGDNPESANELIGHVSDSVTDPATYLAEWSSGGTMLTAWTSGFCDMRHIHSLYLHSTVLGSYKTIGPLGSNTAVRRIPVTDSVFGTIVTSDASHHLDFLDCAASLSTIDFQLRDGKGHLVQLHGAAGVSFSLLFAERPIG